MKPFKAEILAEKYEEALKGMFNVKGKVTIEAYESCTLYCGDITLKDGRPAQVHLTVQADKENFF